MKQKGKRPAATSIDTAVPPAIAHRLSVPPATSEVERLAIHAHQTDPVFGGTVDDVLKKIDTRTGKPSRNGKHHTNGDGKHD